MSPPDITPAGALTAAGIGLLIICAFMAVILAVWTWVERRRRK